ncbi:hypothetical protein CP97_04045 [Aurantiacibacter atlanticus]|uniref:Uncharacterized protein n=1 Tax=Aurantiacibacter atlanticus TaxID=1648404 RepID=A0A0H4VJT3_9SPHN|nr:hypothetical protein [Aurantiacibacter atlanticus]AKQ43146.2 hypothetical protein CP97_04045 [Aurantiacibacter atlanticus]MDF1833850.1 hypothetical protein [Alteraurantiacibacter sp. bin_em_oilr2.035]
MPRSAIFSFAALLSLGAIAAPVSTAIAFPGQASGPYFAVELAEPTDETRAIAGGVVFTCEGTTCAGPRSGDRPIRVCSELRRNIGEITSFAVQGEPISESQLARCNG